MEDEGTNLYILKITFRWMESFIKVITHSQTLYIYRYSHPANVTVILVMSLGPHCHYENLCYIICYSHANSLC